MCCDVRSDLKSLNILIGESGEIKISDFGSSKLRTSAASLQTKTGTPLWMAPEVMSEEKYTEKADVYSVAMLFYEIISGSLPFGGITNPITLATKVVVKNERPDLKPFKSFLPPQIIGMIEDMWNGEASKRPSMEVVVATLQSLLSDVMADTVKVNANDTMNQSTHFLGDFSVPPAINPLRFTRMPASPKVLSVTLDSKEDSVLLKSISSYLLGPQSLPEFSASTAATTAVNAVISAMQPAVSDPTAIDRIECVWNESLYRSFVHGCHTVDRRATEVSTEF